MDRSMIEFYEAQKHVEKVARWQDDYDDPILLDSLKTKGWNAGPLEGGADQGTGIWAPEKRAVIEMHNLKNLLYSEAWVFIICDLYAKKIARQPITVAKEQFSNGKRTYKAVDDHPLLKSFRRPNHWENYRSFMTRLVMELTCMGNAVIWQMKYSKGMMLLPSELIQLDFDNRSRLKNYRFLGTNLSEDIQLPGVNRADFVFRPEDAIHVKMPNPNSMLWGLSPFVPGRRSVLFDRYSTDYLLNFYWNQGNAGMVLEMDKEANENNAVRLLKSYEIAMTGRRNQRRTMLLPKGVKASNTQQHMSDQQFVDNVRMRREEIIAILHVPPHEVGLNTNGSLGSDETKQALLNFWEAGLMPAQELIADAMTQAWRRTGDLAEDEEIQFDNSDVKILQENNLEKAKTANEMLKTKTINEVREEVWELKPLPGADVLTTEFEASMAKKYAQPQFGSPFGGGGGGPEAGAVDQPAELPAATEPDATGNPVDAQEEPEELVDEPLAPEPVAEPEQKAEPAPRRVATVAMFCGDSILMGERRDNGRWTNPGGHLNEGEEPAAGAMREFKEETGHELDPAMLQPAGEPREVTNDKGERLTIYPFKVEVDERPAVTTGDDPDGEIKRWGWVNVERGIPKAIREALHVPLKNNVLMECCELKGSAGFLRTNKSWFGKRSKSHDDVAETAKEVVLESTLELLANFAKEAVLLADGERKAKSKAKDDEGEEEKPSLPRRAAIRRQLDRAFDKYQEQWVDENVRALTNTMEFGYGLQLQTPFNIPNQEEVEALRARNEEGRREVLANRLLRSFDQISKTTTEEVMDIIADGLEESQTLDQIRRSIVDKIAGVDGAGYRAERIARTEALSAVSLGQYAASKDVAKVIPGMELMWVTAGDARVRDTHAGIDGDRVKAGEKFANGLQFPRDPAGAADEVINCRCTFLMVPPEGDNLDDSGIQWTGNE